MNRRAAVGSLVAIMQLAVAAALAESPEAIRAKEQLAPYRQMPKFEAPGEALDAAACMKDKAILSIPASSAVPFIKTIQTTMEQVAKDVDLAFRLKARFPTVAHMTSVVANAIDGANSFTLGPPCRDLVPLPVAA